MSVGSVAMNGFLMLLLLAVFAGCNRTETEAQSLPSKKPLAQTAPAKPNIEACALIKMEEVSAIQGATVTEAKSSTASTGTLAVSQCYYNSKEPNMSVSLALIETDPPHSSHADLMSYWKESFGHSESGEEKSPASKQKPGDEPGETERRTPPRKIDGIGDDACWLSSRYSGALYVLKGDVIIRVSVGGPDSEESKIGKSKLLAQKALARL